MQQSITLYIFLNYPHQEARAFHQVSNHNYYDIGKYLTGWDIARFIR